MKKKKIYGSDLKEQLLASARDRLHRFLLADGAVRGAIVQGTRMVNEMRTNHELGILETLVLGHAYLAAALLSANLKGRDRFSLQVECAGPVKGLVVECNAYNEVRGYLKNVPIPIDKPLTDFNLSRFFGSGFLSLTRYLEDAKQPFTGQVAMAYGSIAKDLANYFLTSEQIPTAFHLSVQFDRQGAVIGAGGLFLQAMPGADAEVTAGLEDLVRDLPSLGQWLSAEKDPEKLIRDVFKAYGPAFHGSRRVEFLCHCNAERLHNMLTLLPPEELTDMLQKDEFPLEIRCHHCNTAYRFSRSDIHEIYGKRFSNN